MSNIFAFDAETDGLWGPIFAIGAVVLDETGAVVSQFFGCLPKSVVTVDWVKENVCLHLPDVPTHADYQSLLADFAKFYLANKAGTDLVVHMGYIVEARLLRDMHEAGLIGDWDGPYPLFDLASDLRTAGFAADSVDGYITAKGLEVPVSGATHNPLYDAAAEAVAYRSLTR